MQINSVIIVGGGTSGWFTAAALNKHCPEVDVTLIESPTLHTIGVGESTLLHINRFFQSLDMKDEDWMPHCDATYKGSIKFTDFYKKGEVFHYPFGFLDFTVSKHGTDDWFFKKWIYPDTPQSDFADTYWPAMPLINKNRVNLNEENIIPNFNIDRDWAYQFDAGKLGHWMRENLCTKTTYIRDHVTDIKLDERGWISFLTTKEHGDLTADLYVDSTGFRSLLLGQALKVPYISYSDMLINNGTWATKIPYVDPNVEMDLTTNGTAIDNGWVWNIPLWSRIGSGYVYSKDFIDKDDALVEFQKHIGHGDELDYHHIDIRNGRYKKCWHKNCLAIGLSYGFVEPLESTGLVFAHEGADKLVMALQSRDRHITQLDRDCVNREMQIHIDGVKYFVGFHFYGSVRDDTEYWRWYTQELEMGEHWNDTHGAPIGAVAAVHGRKDETMELSRARFHVFESGGFSDGVLCVIVGHHINLYSDYIRAKIAYRSTMWPWSSKEFFKGYFKEVFDYWDERKRKINMLADKSPTMYEYLKENIHK